MKIRTFGPFALYWMQGLALTQSVEVGDTICVEGFVMDNLCITRGTLLDRPDLASLQFPQEHSLHCLVDISSCRASGYTILKGPVNGLYSIAYRVDTAGTETLVALGREAGQRGGCTTCTGSGNLVKGLRAEVSGVVTDASNTEPVIRLTASRISNGKSNFCANAVPAPTAKVPITAPTAAVPVAVPTPVKVPTPTAAVPTPTAATAPTVIPPTVPTMPDDTFFRALMKRIRRFFDRILPG